MVMETLQDYAAKFFGVALRGQTYLNNLYLFLAFPLGLFYFIFLVSGLAISIPLIIIWIGLLFLLIVFTAWYGMAAFERQMAIWLLHENIPPMVREDLSQMSMWQKFTATVRNPVTWKGLVYLFGKFPLGLVSFVMQVTLVSVSISLLAAPLYYRYIQQQVGITLHGDAFNSIWIIDTLPEAIIAFFTGVFLTLVSMHILNGLAWVSGKFARVMLGNYSTKPMGPAASQMIPVEPTAPVVEIASTTPDTPDSAVMAN
jgi:hypothetical protein